MLKLRNYNEMVTYILDKIREMDISEDDKKALFAYITSLESKYFMEMGNAQRWIPCSERLPEERDHYICTCKDGYRTMVTYVKWQDKLKKWDLTGTRSYWKVIAWMPLPEPYMRGEEDE